MRNVYLLLTLVGTVVPYVFFLGHFQAAGFGPGDFFAGAFANGVAGGLTADVLIASAAFWVYLTSRKVAGRGWYMLLNVTIGLSCALPLYLYVTERALSTAPPRAAVA
jgi:hypothetical protein